MEDPKEVAEHVMLIDLARNDVGRVVTFGTEHVDETMVVERYSHIMHLTSQVSGTLAPGSGPIDVLRATLPAGTLSGAPKVRAMEIIDDLEPTKRGIYGGVVGYLDFSGNLDTAIAIRTMTVSPDGRASVQAGAGIVADSDPDSENAECAHKAAAMLAAVAMARRAAREAGAHAVRPDGAGGADGADPTDGPEGRGRQAAVAGPDPGPTGDADYDALRSGVGWFRPARDVLAVSGPDAASYLQGQCSNDVAALAGRGLRRGPAAQPPGPPRRPGPGDPDGRRPLRPRQGAGTGPDVLARLERFRLRTKVEFEPLDWSCLSVRGPAAGEVTVPDRPGVLRLPVDGPGPAGFDLLGPGPTVDGPVREVGGAAWEAVRIESGVPRAGRELTRRPSPPRRAWSNARSRSPRAATPGRSWWPAWTPGGRTWPGGCGGSCSTWPVRRTSPRRARYWSRSTGSTRSAWSPRWPGRRSSGPWACPPSTGGWSPPTG